MFGNVPKRLGTESAHAPTVTPRRLAFAEAAFLVLVSVVAAGWFVSIDSPSCPVGTVAVRNLGAIFCERYVNPTDAPSHVELVQAHADRKVPERLMIVGVGALGAILLVALGLRLSASGRTEPET